MVRDSETGVYERSQGKIKLNPLRVKPEANSCIPITVSLSIHMCNNSTSKLTTRTGAGTETRAVVAEIGTGTRIGTGAGTRTGSGRAAERRTSARNRIRGVDAMWKTRET